MYPTKAKRIYEAHLRQPLQIIMEIILLSATWLAIFTMVTQPLTCFMLRCLQTVCAWGATDTFDGTCGTLASQGCQSTIPTLCAVQLTAVLPFILARLIATED